MGWKAFALFATDKPRGFFGESHTHEPDRADEIVLELGLTDYEVVGPSTLDQGLYPPRRTLFVGAYPGGLALCHQDLPVYLFPEHAQNHISGPLRNPEKTKSALLSLYPEGDVLAIVLHSVVDLWGYSLYSRGSLVRCAAGTADDGILANIGSPLPEELPILQQSAVEEAGGEELLFEVTRRFFGRPIADFERLPLQMTELRKPRPSVRSFFSKLLGQR